MGRAEENSTGGMQSIYGLSAPENEIQKVIFSVVTSMYDLKAQETPRRGQKFENRLGLNEKNSIGKFRGNHNLA